MRLAVKRVPEAGRLGMKWGIYDDKELVEGFYTRERAMENLVALEREILQDEIEIAERRAGWDPNP